MKGVGCTTSSPLYRTGGNPRISPGCSVVVVASFLKVLPGTRRFEAIGAWWAFSGGRSGCGSLSFSSSHHCRHCFLLFFFFCSFGLVCAVCPSIGFKRVLVGCYIYIAGRKPVSWVSKSLPATSRDRSLPSPKSQPPLSLSSLKHLHRGV